MGRTPEELQGRREKIDKAVKRQMGAGRSWSRRRRVLMWVAVGAAVLAVVFAVTALVVAATQ